MPPSSMTSHGWLALVAAMRAAIAAASGAGGSSKEVALSATAGA